MKHARSVGFLVAGLCTLAACGDKDVELVGPAAEDCPSPPYFSVSPVDMADIEGIVVFGGLGAPGHTLPTAHAGFYLANEGALVRAPGAIQIVLLRRTTYVSSPNRQGQRDYAAEFQVCKQVSGWFGHLTTLSANIPSNLSWTDCSTYSTSTETVESCRAAPRKVTLSPGQLLGTGGLSKALGLMGLDIGLRDSRVNNVYIASWRFSPDVRHAICAWDKFESTVQAALFSKLADKGRPGTVPAGSPRCGTMSVDVPSTAKGVWALPSETAPVGGNETGYITLANYPYRPEDRLALSLAPTTLGATVAVVARASGTSRVNRPFEDVTNDGQIYCYGPDAAQPSGGWLIQVTGPSTLRIRRVVSVPHVCASSPATWSMNGATDFVR